MDERVLVALIAGTALVIAEIVRSFLSRAKAKSDLENDLELYTALPDASDAKVRLLADIDRRITNRISDQAYTRYWFGIVFSLVLVGVGAWTAYLFFTTAEWWRYGLALLSAALLLFGIVGLYIYIPKRERGADGNEIKRQPQASTIAPSPTD